MVTPQKNQMTKFDSPNSATKGVKSVQFIADISGFCVLYCIASCQ